MHKVLNPFSSEVLYEYDYTSEESVFSQIEILKTKGREAQEGLSFKKRNEILLAFYKILKSNKEILAKQITLETGKLLSESLGEVDRAMMTTEVCAREVFNLHGEGTQDLEGSNYFSFTQRKPFGLVMCITPFNFPLNLALHKVLPAFAVGNTVLLKPSECNYKLACMIKDCLVDAGMNKNILTVISPTIQTLNKIVASKKIDLISFTGGTKTADKICQLAGRKKILLELGGNDPLVVFPDGDIDKAVAEIIVGRFGTNGQKCTSSKRIYIHEDVYDLVKIKLLEGTKDYQSFEVQDPLSLESIFAPLINESAAKKVASVVQNAIDSGARLIFGHKRIGAFYAPTMLEAIDPSAELVCEETFGPVISLIKFKETHELVSSINSSNYGLQAGIFSSNIHLIKELYDKIEVGTVIANSGPGFRREHLPFGGVKDSGFGREGVKFAMEDMSYIKQLIF